MTELVALDEKGRLVLPKKIRSLIRVTTPGWLIIHADERKVELIPVDPEMKASKEVAKRKLSDWREQEHEASRLAFGLVKREER